MKAALLICDHVPDQFSIDHGDYKDMFTHLFNEVDLDPYYVIDSQFPNPDDYSSFIMTGSKYSVYDDESWIAQLKDFTLELYRIGKKLVGICFGHQIIAEALGGKVERSEEGYLIGIHHFQFTQRREWMVPKRHDYEALMLCQDQIKDLPKNATVLAGSEHCPIGMYVVGNQFLGIQGHPEFTKEYNQAVFESRPEKISKDKMDKAISGFTKDPDQELLRNYILNFLNT